MFEDDMLTDFFRLVGELPTETQKKFSDLVSLVSDPARGSAWRTVAMRFARQAHCRIPELAGSDRLVLKYDRKLEKLGRMARAVFSQELTDEGKLRYLVQAGTLRVLCTIATRLNPENEDGAQWYEEFCRLFEPFDSFYGKPQYCWDLNRLSHRLYKKPMTYLHSLHIIKCKEYRLILYELVRKGTLEKIIESMRPHGDFVATSLPSRGAVTAHCNAFDGVFRSIRGNSSVFLPYVDEDNTSKHFLATADYSIYKVREVTTYSMKDGKDIVFDPDGEEANKRVFVFVHRPEPFNLRYSS